MPAGSERRSPSSRRASAGRRATDVASQEHAHEGRRRREDRRLDALVAAFARHLIAQPDLDAVADYLFALLCFPLGATEVAITSRYERGDLRVIGRYPLHASLPDDSAAARSSLDVQLVVEAAVQRGGPIVWTDEGGPAAGQPKPCPITAWPLGCPADPDAFLIVKLATPLDPRIVADRLRGLVEVLALYVLRPDSPDAWRVGSRRSHLAPRVTVAAGTTSVASPEGVALTRRQCRILHLLARGLTNPQIAARVGFSTSTVRLETLTIFRALGVHDRKHAVEAAEALGLFVPEDDPTREPTCAVRTA
jgi:DNA-binding CsgD family transcriptional regulator